MINKENNCGIYQIKNIISNKIYIGSSKNLERRKNEHFMALKRGMHDSKPLQEDWNCLTEECFEFSILELCDEDYLLEREQCYLDVLQPFVEYDNGYNTSKKANRPQNSYDGIRVFKNTYRFPNPFYKKSKNNVKKLLKQIKKEYRNGELGVFDKSDYYIPFIDKEPEDINTTSFYTWYELSYDECIVDFYGKSRVMSQNKVEDMSREELYEYMWAMNTYDEIAAWECEFGDPDDWC